MSFFSLLCNAATLLFPSRGLGGSSYNGGSFANHEIRGPAFYWKAQHTTPSAIMHRVIMWSPLHVSSILGDAVISESMVLPVCDSSKRTDFSIMILYPAEKSVHCTTRFGIGIHYYGGVSVGFAHVHRCGEKHLRDKIVSSRHGVV